MNIKDIATLAETSVATVSRVINNENYVSNETRKRVLEVIEATGYNPTLTSRSSRSQRSGRILVLMPSISNPYYSRVLQGVELRASAHGYDVLACITHRDAACETRYLNLVRTKLMDGAISFTTTLPVEQLEQFAAKYPYVQCGARVDSTSICYTCIDNTAATKEAIEYFIRSGHTRIAFINGLFDRPYERDRETGYKLTLAEHGIPFRPEYLRGCDYNYTDGFDVCRELMELPDPPTAIFTSSDQMAAGVTKYLLSINKMPGKDVDVIGFDGTYLSDICSPAISSIKQPGYELGKTAFDLIYEQITNTQQLVKRVIISHKLTLKDTTRPIPPDTTNRPELENNDLPQNAAGKKEIIRR